MTHTMNVLNNTGSDLQWVVAQHTNDQGSELVRAETLASGATSDSVTLQIDASDDYFAVSFLVQGGLLYCYEYTQCNVHQTGPSSAPTTIELTLDSFTVNTPNSPSCSQDFPPYPS